MVTSPWKILHIELENEIPELPALPDGYGGLFVVFWWHRIPLGQHWIHAGQLPITASYLTTLAVQAIAPAGEHYALFSRSGHTLPALGCTHHPPDLEKLVRLASPLSHIDLSSPSTTVSISVVICTRDRPQQLTGCLQAIDSLSRKPDEIIVVDNAPTTDLTRQLLENYPHVRYVLEPRPGLSVARNTGIRHSQCDLIAFTDDDVVVHPDWLLRLQQGFDDPNVMATTGLMLPAQLDTEAQLLFQGNPEGPSWDYRPLMFDKPFFINTSREGVPVWHIGAGANMAFRRSVFELIGGFDERLGAGASGCSEDSEFWYRILANGWCCRYEPTSVVFHYHRHDMDGLKHQMFHYMRGHVVALFIQFERYRHWGNLRRAFVLLPIYYFHRLKKGIKTKFRGKQSTLLSEISGYFAGFAYYLGTRLVGSTANSSISYSNDVEHL